MWRFALQKPLSSLARGFSTVQRGTGNKKVLLSRASNNTGRRFMGYQADISTMEAFLYVVVGGGGVALFGMYKTMQMRERIEAFETGQVIPFQGPTDQEIIEFKETIARLVSGEVEEEVADEEDSDAPGMISKSDKDKVIFIDAPED